MELTEKDIARFWSKVDKKSEDECWDWNAARTSDGYGIFGLGKKLVLATHVSWEIHNGDMGRMWALHSCDRPPCVNPKHLFLGTCQNNTDDRQRKGRGSKPPINNKQGEDHSGSKLSNIQVKEIREKIILGHTVRALAKEYGIGYAEIWRIGKGIRRAKA